MSTQVEALFKNLNIARSATLEDDLNNLIMWCNANLSTDRHFEGTIKERFDSYVAISTDFLTNVVPFVTTKKTEIILERIVTQGFDMYLRMLSPSKDLINTPIKSGLSLVQLAAAKGYPNTVEALLSLGATLEETRSKGNPILFSTLRLPIEQDEQLKENKQAIYNLLSKHIDPLSERNEAGDNIAHIMASYGYGQLLQELQKRSSLDKLCSLANYSGEYPIHSAILQTQYDCVELLVACDGVETLVDAQEYNILHYAAKYGDKRMIKILLNKIGHNSELIIDSRDKENKTPLMLASMKGNTDVVNELLNANAPINSVDDLNRSALHYAIEKKSAPLIELLLQVDEIDVNIRDDEENYPLDLLDEEMTEYEKICKLLIEKGANQSSSFSSSI